MNDKDINLILKAIGYRIAHLERITVETDMPEVIISNNNEINDLKLLMNNLILSEEVNSEEILSLNPHIKKSTIELKEKIELLKREMNTTKDLPWLEKAKLENKA